MDAEFFIHGPRNAFYGRQEEIPYCRMFDNSQIRDKVRFVVDVRNGEDGRRYTYYTYCRYSNVQDVDGRNGAYIGLTVRLDVYYSNLRNLFTVLDATFNAKVVGLLVKKSGDGYQYLVNDFRNSSQAIANTVERCVGTMLMGIIAPDEVYAIDSSFSTGGRELVKGLDDNQFAADRLYDVRKFGKLVFSSSRNIEAVEHLKSDLEKQCHTLLEEKDVEIAGLRSSLDALNKEKEHLSKEISRKDSQIASCDREKSDLMDKLVKREGEVSKLSKEVHRNGSAYNGPERNKPGDDGSVPHPSGAPGHPHSFVSADLLTRFSHHGLGEGLKKFVGAFFLVTVLGCEIFSVIRLCDDQETDNYVEEHREEAVSGYDHDNPVHHRDTTYSIAVEFSPMTAGECDVRILDHDTLVMRKTFKSR